MGGAIEKNSQYLKSSCAVRKLVTDSLAEAQEWAFSFDAISKQGFHSNEIW